MLKRIFFIFRDGNQDDNPTTRKLLLQAVKQRNLEVSIIYANKFDFSQISQLRPTDGLYRVAVDKQSRLIEKVLLATGQPITFYQNNNLGIRGYEDIISTTLLNQKSNLPIIKTIYHLTRDRQLLKKYVDYLGGFPLIIKTSGSSHGIGVMKLDSFDSLISVVDYLVKTQDRFIMRRFIDYTQHARLIVLGNKVIGSIEYKKIRGDFRSNVGDKLNVHTVNFSNEIQAMAIKATHAINIDFSGTDILIDREGNGFIAEVNFPCFFPRVQLATGIDIAGQMIDYLIQKSKNKNLIL